MVQQIKQSSIANFYLIQFQFKDVNVAIVSKVTSKNFEQVKLTWTDTSATFSHSGLFNGKLGILRKFKSVSFKLFMRGEEMYAAHFQVKPTTQVRLQVRGRRGSQQIIGGVFLVVGDKKKNLIIFALHISTIETVYKL